jgi:hypothetical protein
MVTDFNSVLRLRPYRQAHIPIWTKSKSKSHCDWRSLSKSWCRTPSGAHDQIFITVWQLRSFFFFAPSLARGRVCLLYMLLALTSAVFLESESLGTWSQIWNFPFRRLLRLAGSRRCASPYFIWPPYNPFARTKQKKIVSNSTSIVEWVFFATGTCLPRRCLETALRVTVYLFTSWNRMLGLKKLDTH